MPGHRNWPFGRRLCSKVTPAASAARLRSKYKTNAASRACKPYGPVQRARVGTPDELSDFGSWNDAHPKLIPDFGRHVENMSNCRRHRPRNHCNPGAPPETVLNVRHAPSYLKVPSNSESNLGHLVRVIAGCRTPPHRPFRCKDGPVLSSNTCSRAARIFVPCQLPLVSGVPGVGRPAAELGAHRLSKREWSRSAKAWAAHRLDCGRAPKKTAKVNTGEQGGGGIRRESDWGYRMQGRRGDPDTSSRALPLVRQRRLHHRRLDDTEP